MLSLCVGSSTENVGNLDANAVLLTYAIQDQSFARQAFHAFFDLQHAPDERSPEQVLKCNMRFEIACIVYAHGHRWHKQQRLQVLGRIRNLLSHRVLLIDREENLTPEDHQTMLSLGFAKLEPVDTGTGTLLLYQYNIAQYNRKRDWNNARHWANPERFHTHRW